MSRRKKAMHARQARARRRRRWLLASVAASVIVAGIWVVAKSGRPSVTGAEPVAYAPVRGSLTLPASVTTVAPEVREIYEFAARRPDVLHFLPCFCGCWRVGHKSNYDCFIDVVRPDGLVDIDEMGFT